MVVIGLGVLAYYVYCATIRNLTPLESVLFGVVVIILEFLGAYCFGQLSAREVAAREYRRFARSALRRIYGLAEGIENVNRAIEQGRERMSRRDSFQRTETMELWNEILNITSAQLEIHVSGANASIEDWKEFAPEETRELAVRRKRIDEETEETLNEIDRLQGLHDELREISEESGEPYDERLESLGNTIHLLRDRLSGLRSRSALWPTEITEDRRPDLKSLLASGAYEDAIAAYGGLLTQHPTMHTLHIGRARARWLAGDRLGAFADLDEAGRLKPGDPHIENLREKMRRGLVIGGSGEFEYRKLASQGNEALSAGKSVEARRRYKEAEAKGQIPAYTATDLAMVAIFEGNGPEAKAQLSIIDRDQAREFMQVNLAGLDALINTANGVTPDLEPLRNALTKCGSFAMSLSPLRYLYKGLRVAGKLTPETERIFNALEGQREPEERPSPVFDGGSGATPPRPADDDTSEPPSEPSIPAPLVEPPGPEGNAQDPGGKWQ